MDLILYLLGGFRIRASVEDFPDLLNILFTDPPAVIGSSKGIVLRVADHINEIPIPGKFILGNGHCPPGPRLSEAGAGKEHRAVTKGADILGIVFCKVSLIPFKGKPIVGKVGILDLLLLLLRQFGKLPALAGRKKVASSPTKQITAVIPLHFHFIILILPYNANHAHNNKCTEHSGNFFK